MNRMKADNSINCNGLFSILKNPLEVICIHETNELVPFKLKGYQKPVYKNRLDADHPGGSVCKYMCVKNDITFKEKITNYDSDIEFVAIEVIGKNENFTVINYYAHIIKYSYDKLKYICGNNLENAIIAEDFNLKHPCWNPELDESEESLAF
jgi:hypothetical protein